MAQIQADSVQETSSVPLSMLINLTGGVVSIALMVGIGVWGYKTLVRDVSEVPVVRAAADPMRVAPEDPGGMLSGNVGLAVNKVAAAGLAEKPADRLILAPEPISVALEDIPSEMIEERRRTRAQVEERAKQAAADAADPIAALTKRLLEDADPLSDEEVAPVTTDSDIARALLRAQDAVTAEETKVAVNLSSLDLSVHSLRPRMRPLVTATSAPQAPVGAPAPIQAAIDVDPASIPTGTRLAQLGAYDSVETAQREWSRFAARFGDYMADKQRVIQKASSGGRTFYRLRVMNFEDLSAARHFCAALVAENADCIPVVSK